MTFARICINPNHSHLRTVRITGVGDSLRPMSELCYLFSVNQQLFSGVDGIRTHLGSYPLFPILLSVSTDTQCQTEQELTPFVVRTGFEPASIIG
jgi:hypothetical protein